MISGSSGLNLMYYIRGAVKRVFERWVNEFNCTDWTLDDVNPYFMKSEDNDVNWNNPTHHSYGCDNLLAVSVPVVPDNIGFFETAGAQLNPPIPKVADINGGYEDECFCTVQTTTRNGRRWSAAKAFLKQIKYFLNYRLAWSRKYCSEERKRMAWNFMWMVRNIQRPRPKRLFAVEEQF